MREIIILFSGNTMRFSIKDKESEDKWKSVLDNAISEMLNGGLAFLLKSGDISFLVSHNFIGYIIQNKPEDKIDRMLGTIEKLADPDKDEPWKQ